MNIKKLYNKSFTTNPDMKLAYNTAINDCMELFNKDKIRMLKSICKNDCSDRSYSNCSLKRGMSGKCHVSDLIKRITEGK